MCCPEDGYRFFGLAEFFFNQASAMANVSYLNLNMKRIHVKAEYILTRTKSSQDEFISLTFTMSSRVRQRDRKTYCSSRK